MNKQILEKARKVLALINSPEEHEAQAAWNVLNRMILRYCFSLDDLTNKPMIQEGVITLELKMETFEFAQLIGSISHGYHGQAIMLQSDTTVKVYIPVVFREIFHYLANSIPNRVYHAACLAWALQNTKHGRSLFIQSFVIGAGKTIRLCIQNSLRIAGEETGCMALIEHNDAEVLKKFKQDNPCVHHTYLGINGSNLTPQLS